jgi:hypothetical protein
MGFLDRSRQKMDTGQRGNSSAISINLTKSIDYGNRFIFLLTYVIINIKSEKERVDYVD